MPRGFNVICKGPIEGLHLPRNAWVALHKADIRTLDQLRAVADQIERVVDGVGSKTAQAIRAEIARIGPAKEVSSETQ